MTNSILLLTDYKEFYGSKQKTPVYRGGMDLTKLISIFYNFGFQAKAQQLSNIDYNIIKVERPIILYTSSEDQDSLYKSFIEDIILHLQNCYLSILPCFEYLHVHNNKVAMELLREASDFEPIRTIRSRVFGTVEELEQILPDLVFPVVIKTAKGAMSKGVAKADSPSQLIKLAKHFSKSTKFKHDFKEILRLVKYRNTYVRESFYRNKFVIQNFIPGLNNDWKVLVYSNRCYVLFRGNRNNDFRASGSGKFIFTTEIPDGILDYALNIKNYFKVPHISLDIGYDGNYFHLIEFQFLYFGTTTLEKSPFYFEKQNDVWVIQNEKSCLEEVYVRSIIDYLNQQKI